MNNTTRRLLDLLVVARKWRDDQADRSDCSFDQEIEDKMVEEITKLDDVITGMR